TLPSEINLVSPSGHAMSVNDLESSDKYTHFDDRGRTAVRIGGTLHMSANQPVDDYTGTMSFTVNYY
ncbi:MAG: DUF4402 domain-containing protein, partial [Gammaproteobacteria bacterium]